MIFALLIALVGTATAQEATSAEALESLRASKRLTARRLAEEVLSANPDDFVAEYVVAEVYWKEDGNLPRALYHFKRADKLFTRDEGVLPEESWRTHWYVLRGLAFVAESMENPGLFLETVERYNGLYNPDLVGETGWVLMKEERFAESRQVAEQALASEDQWQKTLGYNVLCALEAKRRDRAASVTACMASLEYGRQTQSDVVVDAYNASTSTLAALDFERTEELLKESTRGSPGQATSPWMGLAGLYLAEGRGAEAVGAIRQMQAWRHAQDPPSRAQSRASADAALAMVLLVAGESDKGLEVIERALTHPDRRATTTSSGAATLAANTLIRFDLRALSMERADEAAAMDGILSRMGHWAGSWLPDPAVWDDTTTLGGILSDGDLLARSLSPYEDDGMILAPWMTGDLVHILGPGVVQAGIDRGRERDAYPGLQAYYDGLEAEVAWARGDSRAVDLAERALADLPKQEVLLRGRIAAVGAAQAWQDGDPRAYGLYERAMQLDPSALRRLGLALPATVSSGGTEVDQAAAAMLRRSPRIRKDAAGFTVVVSGAQVCVSSPMGSRLGCYRGQAQGEVEERARSAVQAFHDGAFALPLGLSLVDMRSLDGTTRLAEEDRRKALDTVLEAL